MFSKTALILVFWLLCFTNLSKAQLKAGDKAPGVFITDWIANTPQSKDFKGKFVIIDFWATWCAPCLESMPHMNDLVDQYKSRKDLVFIAMTDEERVRVEGLLKRVPISSIVVSDMTRTTFRDFQIKGRPTCMVINPEGRIEWVGHSSKVNSAIIDKILKGENPGSISATLLKQYSKINWWYEYQRAHPDKEYGDSLVSANLKFQELLGKYGKIPSTLSANFKELKGAGIHITTSEDKLFRIYSWDTQLGGTMRIFYNVLQYKKGNRVFTKATREKNFDAGKFYTKIFTHRVNGNVYYLACSSSIFSSRDNRQEISVFNISSKGLEEHVKLIKTKRGLTGKLTLDYNFFSVVDRPERPVELIKYDTATGVIKLALVDADLNVTNKFITYKFTGKYFEKQ